MSSFLHAPAILVVLGMAGAQAQSIDRQGPSQSPRSGTSSSDTWRGEASRSPAETEKMPRILNDTREFCEVLRQDIARIRSKRGDIPAEPAMLAREGERMCLMGHFRPGIYRLRSALMLLRPAP